MANTKKSRETPSATPTAVGEQVVKTAVGRNARGFTQTVDADAMSFIEGHLPYSTIVKLSGAEVGSNNKLWSDYLSGYAVRDLITKSREHSTWPAVKEVMQIADLTHKEMAYIMGVSDRQLFKGSTTPMSTAHTEKLLTIKTVFELGLQVFGNNPATLNRWLKTPNEHLAKTDRDFPAPTTDYEVPGYDDLFVSQTPDLFEAAKQNQQALQKHMQQNPYPDKAYPTPLSILDTMIGIMVVGQLLGQMAYGIYI